MQLGISYNWMRDSPGEIDLESPSWRMKKQWDSVNTGYCDMVCQRESGKDSLMDVISQKKVFTLCGWRMWSLCDVALKRI